MLGLICFFFLAFNTGITVWVTVTITTVVGCDVKGGHDQRIMLLKATFFKDVRAIVDHIENYNHVIKVVLLQCVICTYLYICTIQSHSHTSTLLILEAELNF